MTDMSTAPQYHLLVRLSAMQLGSVVLREIFYVFSERAYTLQISSIAKGSDIAMVSEGSNDLRVSG
jgi:hypothetical protein